MRVEWTPAAEASLLAIARYIAVDDPGAALAIYEEIRRQVGNLAEHPEIGRPGRVLGTRELVINRTPFIAAYRVKQGVVTVLSVLHGKQRWPTTL